LFNSLMDKNRNMLIVEGHKIKNYSEQMSNDELYEFCLQNKGLRIERDKDQNIIIMSPVGGESGYFEKNFMFELELWVRKNKKGLTFSSSTGFLLPNGAMRSPDACWISGERWGQVAEDQKKKFLPVVPEFVVEIKSPTDSLNDLKSKVEEWIENGTRLAWLVDPENRDVYIYRENGFKEVINDFDDTLNGENVLEGFEFDLSQLQLP